MPVSPGAGDFAAIVNFSFPSERGAGLRLAPTSPIVEGVLALREERLRPFYLGDAGIGLRRDLGEL
ncbi:MAG TPA: hypothetical protein VI585_14525, partial [Candidatus Binatia bacterium]